MPKKQKIDESYTEHEDYAEKLNFYQTKLLKSIRSAELLKKLLVVYNKLYAENQKDIRLSSLLCGISSDCLYKLGKCPGIHGIEYLEDFKSLLFFLKEDIILTKITETKSNYCTGNNVKNVDSYISNNVNTTIDSINGDDDINENNIRNYTFKFIIGGKLNKSNMDNIVNDFKNKINKNINNKCGDITIKVSNLKNAEEDRIRRINELIDINEANNGEITVENVLNIISKSFLLKGGLVNKKHEEPKETIYCDDEDEIYKFIRVEIIEMLNKYTKSIGIDQFRFYCHQSEAIKELLKGKNVIITTSTCSGKSMCYIIPSLQYILNDSNHLTLLIFPTKALSEDQLNKINDILSYLSVKNKKVLVNKLDGDTNMCERREILLKSNMILTNIDFIHWNIELLSQHIHSRLRLIVIDEAHVYTGDFGINTSYVLRRLKRGIHYYREKNELIKNNNDSEIIKYIVCTATILNPCEHFKNITGIGKEDIKLVDKDTSYKSESTTIIWDTNKKLDNVNMIKKYKSYNECINIIIELYFLNRRLIVFCSSRKAVENMKRELIIILKRLGIEKSKIYFDYENDIQIYRGGISKTERRKLESLIFNGNVRVVICTVALELGIDVRCFDTVLVYGYPGSVNRLIQQFGRCGRDKNIKSLKILLLNENNELDNYISNHSNELLNRKYDSCVINLKNPYLLILHLICLTVETYKNINIIRDLNIMRINGIDENNGYIHELILFLYYKNVITCDISDFSKIKKEIESIYWYYNWNRIQNNKYDEHELELNNYTSLLNLYFDNYLSNNQLILNDIKDAYKNLDLRNSDSTILIYNYNDQKNPIDSIPIYNCVRFIYPESIYSINGVLYNTISIDLSLRKGIVAEIRNGDPRLKQKTVSSGEVSVLMQGNGEKYEIQNEKLLGMSMYVTGAKVTYNIYSYIIYEYVDNDWLFIEERYIKNPLIYSFSTFGMKIQLEMREKFESEYLNIGIHGIIHNIINKLPKYIYCNVNDVSCECPDIEISKTKEREFSTISLLLYENKKGGNGYLNELLKCTSNSKIKVIEDILVNIYDHINKCKCNNGCLNCGFLLHSCIKNNKYINKQTTMRILENIYQVKI
ncbi:hypothetical protein RS030_81217 [Cryptosporidium xiaoi]|uniref:Uncharacterized protein n=1 Tax=Cryptosporidium xiaoi TaxID=659607 RepID=A0AAV9XU72_9CRYT